MNKTILLVDSPQVVHEMLGNLAAQNFKDVDIVVASSNDNIPRLLKSQPPDLIFLDGRTALGKMYTYADVLRDSDIPVFLSLPFRDSMDFRQQDYPLVNEVMIRPFQSSKLLAAFKKYLHLEPGNYAVDNGSLGNHIVDDGFTSVFNKAVTPQSKESSTLEDELEFSSSILEGKQLFKEQAFPDKGAAPAAHSGEPILSGKDNDPRTQEEAEFIYDEITAGNTADDTIDITLGNTAELSADGVDFDLGLPHAYDGGDIFISADDTPEKVPGDNLSDILSGTSAIPAGSLSDSISDKKAFVVSDGSDGVMDKEFFVDIPDDEPIEQTSPVIVSVDSEEVDHNLILLTEEDLLPDEPEIPAKMPPVQGKSKDTLKSQDDSIPPVLNIEDTEIEIPESELQTVRPEISLPEKQVRTDNSNEFEIFDLQSDESIFVDSEESDPPVNIPEELDGALSSVQSDTLPASKEKSASFEEDLLEEIESLYTEAGNIVEIKFPSRTDTKDEPSDINQLLYGQGAVKTDLAEEVFADNLSTPDITDNESEQTLPSGNVLSDVADIQISKFDLLGDPLAENGSDISSVVIDALASGYEATALPTETKEQGNEYPEDKYLAVDLKTTFSADTDFSAGKEQKTSGQKLHETEEPFAGIKNLDGNTDTESPFTGEPTDILSAGELSADAPLSATENDILDDIINGSQTAENSPDNLSESAPADISEYGHTKHTHNGATDEDPLSRKESVSMSERSDSNLPSEPFDDALAANDSSEDGFNQQIIHLMPDIRDKIEFMEPILRDVDAYLALSKPYEEIADSASNAVESSQLSDDDKQGVIAIDTTEEDFEEITLSKDTEDAVSAPSNVNNIVNEDLRSVADTDGDFDNSDRSLSRPPMDAENPNRDVLQDLRNDSADIFSAPVDYKKTYKDDNLSDMYNLDMSYVGEDKLRQLMSISDIRQTLSSDDEEDISIPLLYSSVKPAEQTFQTSVAVSGRPVVNKDILRREFDKIRGEVNLKLDDLQRRLEKYSE
ncbi:hypothetical protein CHS0354_006895 [Potamilus streckersoni]|uniref:Response regulatory domain-containing protein n=1 Tax=Potamilus streckersoni TaxID=2493646 RepID=A0AAE0TF54_9BIVA|nr:hypothetical protein CHS0354_006895 [Potamilus streckersoni]